MRVGSSLIDEGAYFNYADVKRLDLPTRYAIAVNVPRLSAAGMDYGVSGELQNSEVEMIKLIYETLDQLIEKYPHSRFKLLVKIQHIQSGGAIKVDGGFEWPISINQPHYSNALEAKTIQEIKDNAAILRNTLKPIRKDTFGLGITTVSSQTNSNSLDIDMRGVIDKNTLDTDVADMRESIQSNIDIFKSMGESQYERFRWVAMASATFLFLSLNSISTQGSSYVATPACIASKKCIINPKNTDQECFKYATLAHFAQDIPHPERLSVLKKKSTPIVWPESIVFPFNTMDIIELEAANPGYTWAVYAAETNHDELEVVPIHSTTPEKYHSRELINILVFKNHYMLITDLDRLLSSRGQHLSHCPICIKRFRCEMGKHRQKRDAHTLNCKSTWRDLFQPKPMSARRDNALTPFEVDEKTLFTHVQYRRGPEVLYKPVTLYADLEATGNTSEQKVASVRCKIDFMVGVVVPPNFRDDFVATGPGAAIDFIIWLLDSFHEIRQACCSFKDTYEKVTQADRDHYAASTVCHFCKHEFTSKDKKVLDHCHATGRYRGAAHNKCNLDFTSNSLIKDITVYFHNSAYDTQHIWQALANPRVQRRLKNVRLNAIAQNSERFKSLSIGSFQILDSMSFLGQGLSKALEALPNEKKTSIRGVSDKWARERGRDPDVVFAAMASKQIFPYEYAWHEHLDEPIRVDPKLFMSRLTNAYGLTEADMEERYEKSIDPKIVAELTKLCDDTGIITWRDLHDLYLAIDVNGLADCMRHFRETSFEIYGIDPAYFISNSAFGWKAMLKTTGAKVEILKSSEEYMFCEDGLRGGLSMTRNRLFTANRPDLPDYDTEEPTRNILDLDANALYASVMQAKLPVGGFKFIDPNDFEVNDPRYGGLPGMPGDKREWQGDVGAFVQCDVEYPKELHDDHSDFPRLPETMVVQDHMISESQKSSTRGKNVKLVAHLFNREKYTCHVSVLKFAVSMGLKITKVHQVLEFKQSAWLRPWIDLNTMHRKAATTKAMQDYFKLMSNAVFGKSMEQIYGHTQADFVTTRKQFIRKMSAPEARALYPIAPEFALIISDKKQYIRNKPIFAGCAILDLSKLTMQNFWYKCLKPTFSKGVSLIQTDTDSLIIGLTTPSMDDYECKIMSIRDEWLDMSSYPKGHKFHSDANRKTPGFFKDECGASIVMEVTGLGAKCYSLKNIDESLSCRRAKGVPRRIVENVLTHESYKNVLMTGESLSVGFHSLRPSLVYSKHHIYNVKQFKKALTWIDDKSYFVTPWESRALGHYRNRNI
jgi:hypothetical protein